jgi:hypothetical protein
MSVVSDLFLFENEPHSDATNVVFGLKGQPPLSNCAPICCVPGFSPESILHLEVKTRIHNPAYFRHSFRGLIRDSPVAFVLCDYPGGTEMAALLDALCVNLVLENRLKAVTRKRSFDFRKVFPISCPAQFAHLLAMVSKVEGMLGVMQTREFGTFLCEPLLGATTFRMVNAILTFIEASMNPDLIDPLELFRAIVSVILVNWKRSKKPIVKRGLQVLAKHGKRIRFCSPSDGDFVNVIETDTFLKLDSIPVQTLPQNHIRLPRDSGCSDPQVGAPLRKREEHLGKYIEDFPVQRVVPSVGSASPGALLSTFIKTGIVTRK